MALHHGNLPAGNNSWGMAQTALAALLNAKTIRILLRIWLVLLLFLIALGVYWISSHAFYPQLLQQTRHQSNAAQKLTIRVNTFRRLDLLKGFLEYYATSCPIIEEIQVIWSDTENAPPAKLLASFITTAEISSTSTSRSSTSSSSGTVGKPPSIVFEIHNKNSLSNRFRAKTTIHTEAVLSIDDDLIIPCDQIISAMQVWRSNKRALVGYSPRLHSYDIETGQMKYRRWQHTWWNGIYCIMLTKATFLHKEYLSEYDRVIPPKFLSFIDEARNCEDIAMAFVIALRSKAAPVWVEGTVYEVDTSTSGISSSGVSHFNERSDCLERLREYFPRDWDWVTGHQKSVGLSIFDLSAQLYDYK